MKKDKLLLIERKNEKKSGQRRLTEKQRATLKLLYQFRFMTTELVAQAFRQQHRQSAHATLELLVKTGHIAKRYDPSYRLQHRPAEYYLTKKSISLIRELIEHYSPRELKQLYARPTNSSRFIDRSLALALLFLQLRNTSDESINVFTQACLTHESYEYLPHPPPDTYCTVQSRTETHYYFIEYFDSGVSIGIHGRRISVLLQYEEAGEWLDTIQCLSNRHHRM